MKKYAKIVLGFLLIIAMATFCGCIEVEFYDGAEAANKTEAVNNVEAANKTEPVNNVEAANKTEAVNNVEAKNNSEEDNLENTINYRFRNNSLLEEHFKKHGQEFPYETKEEYLEGANKMLNNPDKLHKNEAEDGDDVYYLEETNEFIIVSLDGYIRTYFKPKRGIDYFNSQ